MFSNPYSHDSSIHESFSNLLSKLSQTKNLKSIKKVHAHLLKTGLIFISYTLQTNLVYTYTKCLQQNNIQILTKFFKCSIFTHPFAFNPILSTFVKNGLPLIAIKTLSFMHGNGVCIDTYALCSSLTASCLVQDVRFGKQIHTHVVKSGWGCSVFLGSALVDFYAKTMAVEDAAKVFDGIPVKNTVCVNALLSAYSDAKMWVDGVELFRSVSGWGCSVFLGSALVDFYAKTMAVEDAAKVFDGIPVKNTVCVNALLSAYSDAKMWVDGVELFRSVSGLGLCYDNWTFSGGLNVCAGMYAVDLGSQIHAKVIRTIYDVGTDVFLLSSLIDLYGKCGLVVKAKRVFDMAGFTDVVLWTSMLGVYGRNGRHEEVIRVFKEMLSKKVRPDGVAFVTVISACGHTGQVDLGTEYFESMVRDFGLNPSPEHYGGLVDLFCRAGELEKAWNVVNEMPSKVSVSVSVWGALLSACCDHGNVDLGKFAAQKALELDPMNTGVYVLLSNMYAKYGLWDEIEELREFMRDKGIKKDIGSSRI